MLTASEAGLEDAYDGSFHKNNIETMKALRNLSFHSGHQIDMQISYILQN